MKNNLFDFEVNENGALTRLSLVNDAYTANFALASENEPWVPENKQWGLGFITVGHNHIQVEKCVSLEYGENHVKAVYIVEFDEPRFACVWDGDTEKSRVHRRISVTVTRELRDDGLYEYYEYKNDSDKYIALDEIGIYSSFRDTYATGDNALHVHVNQHICTRGDLCYIEAQRQSGTDTNVCLITLEGAFESYQIEEQNTSNVRGVIALVAKDIRIGAGETKSFSRVITDCRDRDEFEKKLCQYTGYPIVDYGIMTVEKGESIRVSVKEKGQLSEIKIEGETLNEKDGGFLYTPKETGVYEGRIEYGTKIAKMTFRVIDSVDNLLKKRAEFIVSHQQLLDTSDPRYGAFLPYDIEKGRLCRTEDIEKIYHSIPDRNDVRERMGMGAFLALYARVSGDRSFIPSLELYRDFLLKHIVDENGDVWDSYLRQEGVKYYDNDGMRLTHTALDMRFRTHNFTFAVPFFIEMYALTKEEIYAKTVLSIMERYYEKSKIASFMPNVDEMKLENDKFSERVKKIEDEIQRMLQKTCETGENYKPDEVAYEHGNTASNLKYMTDYYIIHRDDNILPYIDSELKRTLAFDGNQPHFNSNGIPIRHWDAFWFGDYEMWGDTMPHWIGCLSACSYCNYYIISGNKLYLDKALKIFRANFALIKRDGSAYNSYLFNEKSNGRQAGRYDTFSNDQDWIYYYYLKCREKGIFKK